MANQQEDKEIKKEGLPTHLGIILDGNGRWAKQRGEDRSQGHVAGAENAVTIARACLDRGISALSFYAFSTENWKRPKAEITAIMKLLYKFTINYLPEMLERDVRFSVMGDWRKLPGPIRKAINMAIRKTRNNQGPQLNLGLNYGGRDELVRACRKLSVQLEKRGLKGRKKLDWITEESLGACLDTAQLPPLDLIIRTGGELRLSNFMLWQAAYAEFYFTKTLWPDFTEDDLDQALASYAARNRRFGDAQ